MTSCASRARRASSRSRTRRVCDGAGGPSQYKLVRRDRDEDRVIGRHGHAEVSGDGGNHLVALALSQHGRPPRKQSEAIAEGAPKTVLAHKLESLPIHQAEIGGGQRFLEREELSQHVLHVVLEGLGPTDGAATGSEHGRVCALFTTSLIFGVVDGTKVFVVPNDELGVRAQDAAAYG